MNKILLTSVLILTVWACSLKAMGGGTSGRPEFAIAAGDVASTVLQRAPSTQQKTIVRVEFTKSKTEAFREFTKEHLNERVKILIGTKVVAEPIIRSEIPGGKIELSFESPDEAQAVASSLRRK